MKISKLNPKRSLLAKLFVFYIIPFVLFAGAMDFCFSYITNNMINENVLPQFDERLSENARSLAASIDPDLIENASDQGEAILGKLDAFVEKRKGIEYVYVLKRENDSDVIVESPFTPEQAKSINGKEEVLSEIYNDKWDTHKSYFTPIEGTDAIVGIDMDASFIPEMKSKMIVFNILFLISAVLLGAISAYVIGRQIARPVNELVGFTSEMAVGNLSKPITSVRQDEIGDYHTGLKICE
ncbi:hypothetical protein ACFWMS_19350 [Peribacillus butanolivorans]|uniref:HAMP domain-containing protein n=1 Tax=Peribacillus butanolivorans TaxID=421767 RepID=UPI003653D2E7